MPYIYRLISFLLFLLVACDLWIKSGDTVCEQGYVYDFAQDGCVHWDASLPDASGGDLEPADGAEIDSVEADTSGPDAEVNADADPDLDLDAADVEISPCTEECLPGPPYCASPEGYFRECHENPVTHCYEGIYVSCPAEFACEPSIARCATEDIEIDRSTKGAQRSLKIGVMADRFAVIWVNEGSHDGTEIMGRVYSSSGGPMTSAFMINNYTKNDQEDPQIAARGERFIVVWHSGHRDATADIMGKVLDCRGFSITSVEFYVTIHTSDKVYSPQVQAFGDRFVVTWEGASAGFKKTVLFGRFFSIDGQPFASVPNEFIININTTDESGNAQAILMDNRIVVVWRQGLSDKWQVRGQILKSDGTRLLSEDLLINQYTTNQSDLFPQVSAAGDRFMVVWQSDEQEGGELDIFGRIFQGNGHPIGNEFLVNIHTTNNQKGPIIKALADRFAVVWVWENWDGTDSSVMFRIFDNDGNPLTGEVQVNMYTPYTQEAPQIGILENRFVVTWQSRGQDDEGYMGIYARIFSSDGNPLTSEFQVNVYSTMTQMSPVINTVNDRFFIGWEFYDLPSLNNWAAFGRIFIDW